MLDFLLVLILVAVIVALVVMKRGLPSGLRYYSKLARQSGYDPASLLPVYWGVKILLAAILPLLISEIVDGASGVVMLVFAAIGFVIPDLALLWRRQKRQMRIRQALSFFVDLLVSLLRSGLGIEEAFKRAGSKGFAPKHPLAWEVARVSDEIAAGKDRTEAFRVMADRTGVADLQSIAAAIELGGRLGSPIADTLETQAELLRQKRLETGRRRIDRTMLVALFPVLLCGYPLFLVLVAFPMFVEVFRLLKLVRMVFY